MPNPHDITNIFFFFKLSLAIVHIRCHHLRKRNPQLPSPHIATLVFFFCKVEGKKSLVAVAVFWAYLKKYGCLLRKSDKPFRFFIYVTFTFTFTFMHLADAFIQSDLQCIQAIHFFLSMCVPWEINP